MGVIEFRKRSSGASPIAGAVIMIIFAVAVLSLLQFSTPKPPIEVAYSLDPSTIKENERSKLTLTLNNLDLRTHEITISFQTSSRISIYEGNENPLQQGTYVFILDATDPSEHRVFTLSGNLEPGTLSAQYPIVFIIHVDGNELLKTWGYPTLTIQKS